MVRIITTVRERSGKVVGFKHQGPFKVTAVYKDGTFNIRNGTFNERINIQ